MKKTLILSVFLFSFLGLFSQEIMLDKDVEEQYQSNRGPNMRHYGHIYSAYGLVSDLNENPETSIVWWKSWQYMFGYRYKLKLLSFYSIGFDISYKRTRYFLEPVDAENHNPLNPLHSLLNEDKHTLTNNGFGLEFYHRFNIGKRGNTLGKYLDTGIRGQWNFADAEMLLFKYDDEALAAEKVRIKNRGLNYINPFSYGLTARVGFNKIILHMNYRLSDYFKDEINSTIEVDIPEVPRLVMGIQFAI